MRILRLFTTASLILTLLITQITLWQSTNTWAQDMTDLDGHWAREHIEILVHRKILGGFPDGTFRPEGRVSRSEFASILIKSLGVRTHQVPASPSFKDVPASDWAYPYVETARAYGLVSGSPTGFFYPKKPITRLEAMVMLTKAARLPLPKRESANQILESFVDESDVPYWARRRVAAAVQQGVYTNYPDKTLIEPTLSASRAEVAVMSKMALLPHIKTRSEITALTQQQDSVFQGLQSTTIPSETQFTATLQTALNSELNRLGDVITLTLAEPLVNTQDKALIPEGSKLSGTIIRIRPSGEGTNHAQIGLHFRMLALPDGTELPVDIAVASDDELLHGARIQGFVVDDTNNGSAEETDLLQPVPDTLQVGAVYNETLKHSQKHKAPTQTGSARFNGKKPWGRPIVATPGVKLRLKVKLPITVETSPVRIIN